MPGNERQGLIFRQSYCQHRSFSPPAGFHETRSKRDNPGRFFNRKDAGNARRCDFSHAMTDNGRRLNAPGFPKFRERYLHCKNGRLSDLGPRHLRGFFGPAQFSSSEKFARDAAQRRDAGACSVVLRSAYCSRKLPESRLVAAGGGRGRRPCFASPPSRRVAATPIGTISSPSGTGPLARR